MRIGIIGVFGSQGNGSYAYWLAHYINHTHTAYEYNTVHMEVWTGGHERKRYTISSILGEDVDFIEYLIVVQSAILIHNDTDIPLILYTRERVDPGRVVDNPDFEFKKIETVRDLELYDNILFPTINLGAYNPNREKDLLFSDIPWLPLPFKDYVDILERSKFVFVCQRVHEIDCTTIRVIEALACKTIPIIIYREPSFKTLYESMGITEEVAYFITLKHQRGSVEIKEYDIEMANRGYELVSNKFGMELRVKQFLEVIEHRIH